MNPRERRAWIDSASYEELLQKVRFEPVSSVWFQGELGNYLTERFRKMRSLIGDEAHTAASKRVGWDNPFINRN